MQHSIKIGFNFGMTSGIITTLGLMVGLNSGTHSKLTVLGGILTIAIADAFSDALGIHISEESENKHTSKEVWLSTASTFLSKAIFSSTFIIPILLFKLPTAMIVSIIWGLSVLGILSFQMAREQKVQPWKMVLEHVFIAVLVVVIANGVGNWVSIKFR